MVRCGADDSDVLFPGTVTSQPSPVPQWASEGLYWLTVQHPALQPWAAREREREIPKKAQSLRPETQRTDFLITKCFL